jgi:hypothetical protein
VLTARLAEREAPRHEAARLRFRIGRFPMDDEKLVYAVTKTGDDSDDYGISHFAVSNQTCEKMRKTDAVTSAHLSAIWPVSVQSPWCLDGLSLVSFLAVGRHLSSC